MTPERQETHVLQACMTTETSEIGAIHKSSIFFTVSQVVCDDGFIGRLINKQPRRHHGESGTGQAGANGRLACTTVCRRARNTGMGRMGGSGSQDTLARAGERSAFDAGLSSYPPTREHKEHARHGDCMDILGRRVLALAEHRGRPQRMAAMLEPEPVLGRRSQR